MQRSYLSIATILALILCCFVTVKAQTTPPQTDDDKVYQGNEVDKPAELLERPRARTDSKCKMDSSGIVELEVILRKSGRVDISKIFRTSDCETFNKNAYEAAKSIKFNPAIKDGQPVSMSKLVSLSYSIYRH